MTKTNTVTQDNSNNKPYLVDCPPEQNVPTITPFSEIGTPPESISFLKYYGGLALAFLLSGLVIVVGIVPLLPLVLFGSMVRKIWTYFCCSEYRRPPSDLKIAVVGGGWGGVQIISRLLELGVRDITGFETNDDLGGTWHPNLRYHSVQIHGAMWATSFDKYPYTRNDPNTDSSNKENENDFQDVFDGKILGAEAFAYVKRFAKHKKIDDCYQFNSKVVSVRYDSSKRNATLLVEHSPQNNKNKNGTRSVNQQHGPYDFVVYASQASEPKLLDILGQETFSGKILHSLWFKTTQFQEIIQSKAKVVVVGGSKTACDMVLCFQRAGYEHFEWVYRKPYVFWKYELLFHNRSFLNALWGITTVVSLLSSLISSKLMGCISWFSGLFVTYSGDSFSNIDWNKFHFGVLCPKQRRDLATIPQEKRHQSGLKCFHSNALELQNGERLEADYILLGTGCKSGVEKLSFEKDGKPYLVGEKSSAKMLHHFLFPTFPVFGNSSAFWTTFGPKRGVNSADMIVYHLCVRKTLTEDQMETMVSRQLGNSNTTNFLFQREGAVKAWMLMHVNLLLAGLIDVFDFLWHAIEIFCLANLSALKFDVLPKNNTTNDTTRTTIPNNVADQKSTNLL